MITRNIDCIIERRLLVSYRIDPELVDALLPGRSARSSSTVTLSEACASSG